MADYRCPLVEIKIEPHPDADKLELALAGGNVCVVGKGSYTHGDKAAFIPANSLLLPTMLARLDETTKKYLGGSERNRVRAARIRGVVSEGLLYAGPEIDERSVGDDLAEELGCRKYVPPIPSKMDGIVEAGPTVKYDIENIANHPGVLENGEMVYITEKLHGTWCCLGFHPDHGPVVSSKGFSDKGLCFVVGDENKDNLYCQMWNAYENSVMTLSSALDEPVYVLGEVFGRKVQDLDYGFTEKQFRVFDIKISHEYVAAKELKRLCDSYGFSLVPELYAGAWHDGLAEEHRSGKTLYASHIREGCVIRPEVERRDDAENPVTGARLGRVILKAVSPDYLIRKGGTEHQ